MVMLGFTKLSPLQAIIPLPKGVTIVKEGDIRRRNLYTRLTQTALSWKHPWEDSTTKVVYQSVFCVQHHRLELVPTCSYYYDYSMWYSAGLHPKFSILTEVMAFGLPYGEISDMCARIGTFLRTRRKVTRTWVRKYVQSHHLVTLYTQNRRLRVPQAFLKKFRRGTFRAKDFFAESNQERRRLMMRRGIPIDDVLKGLELYDSDQEGQLYREVGGSTRLSYLHVECPSTGERYLLQVPRINERAKTMTPAEARRWTFNLPTDAQFVAEA